eukprot:5717085-Pyramimonas_sp.AAC.1
MTIFVSRLQAGALIRRICEQVDPRSQCPITWGAIPQLGVLVLVGSDAQDVFACAHDLFHVVRPQLARESRHLPGLLLCVAIVAEGGACIRPSIIWTRRLPNADGEGLRGVNALQRRGLLLQVGALLRGRLRGPRDR